MTGRKIGIRLDLAAGKAYVFITEPEPEDIDYYAVRYYTCSYGACMV